jgi:hypothetical protein
MHFQAQSIRVITKQLDIDLHSSLWQRTGPQKSGHENYGLMTRKEYTRSNHIFCQRRKISVGNNSNVKVDEKETSRETTGLKLGASIFAHASPPLVTTHHKQQDRIISSSL